MLPFKLYRVYFDPLNLSNVGDFLFELNSEGIYPSSKRERKIRRWMFTSAIKRHIGRTHVVDVQ